MTVTASAATAAPASATAATGASLHDLPALVVGDLVLAVAPPSDRTTIEIVVERDATLVLMAPPAVTVERATQFVTARRRWVYRKLAEKDALTGPPIVKQFVEGEGFAYLGRSHRLSLTADTPGVRLDRRSSRSSRPGPTQRAPQTRPPSASSEVASIMGASRGRQRGAAAMRRWYIDVGGQWLRRRIRPLGGPPR